MNSISSLTFSPLLLFAIVMEIIIPLILLPIVLFLLGKLIKFDVERLKFSRCVWIILVSGIIAALVPDDLEVISYQYASYLPLIVFLVLLIVLVKKQFNTTFVKAIVSAVILVSVAFGVQKLANIIERNFFPAEENNPVVVEISDVDNIDDKSDDSDIGDLLGLNDYPNKQECSFVTVNEVNDFVDNKEFSNWHYEEDDSIDDYLKKECTLRAEEKEGIYILDIIVYETYNSKALEELSDTYFNVVTGAKNIDGVGEKAFMNENFLFISLFVESDPIFLSVKLGKPEESLEKADDYEEGFKDLAKRVLDSLGEEEESELIKR